MNRSVIIRGQGIWRVSKLIEFYFVAFKTIE